ncbi:MAG: DUF3575 domain-containing protein [Sphingobacteriaceae bacterium]|nr:DUF3575 domain-containing protein [Cytophagaceae bacterium]
MNRFLFFGFCWGLALVGTAQRVYPTDSVLNRVILKIAPLALLDPDGTFEGALEFMPRPKWSIQQSFGYGNSTILPFYRPYDDQNWQAVWRLRTEFRRYIRGGYTPRRTNNMYYAVEGLFKRVHVTQQGAVGRECANGDCAYFQTVRYRNAKDVYALHGKWGWQLASDRWNFDLYVGVGFRQIYLFYRDLPADARPPLSNNFRINTWRAPTEVMVPSVLAGAKVGWLLSGF